MTQSPDAGQILSLRDALTDELQHLFPGFTPSDPPPPSPPPHTPAQPADPHLIHILDSPPDRYALCLSGGGIRSATFCLGVIQGLARRGLLHQFHYLSTVSGGGYIGSWLSAWTQHLGGDVRAVEQALGGPAVTPPRDASPSACRPDAPAPEHQPLDHLRRYANYITPRLGLLSADTWTVAGTVIRNLLVNWFVALPLLAAILLLPRIGIGLLRTHPPAQLAAFVLGAGLACAVHSYGYVSRYRPSAQEPRP